MIIHLYINIVSNGNYRVFFSVTIWFLDSFARALVTAYKCLFLQIHWHKSPPTDRSLTRRAWHHDFFVSIMFILYLHYCLHFIVSCKKHPNLFTMLICCLIVLICHRAPTLFAHALHDPVIGSADDRLWFLSAKPNAQRQFPVFNICILPPPPLLSFHHPSWTLFQELPEPTHGSILSSQEADCKKNLCPLLRGLQHVKAGCFWVLMPLPGDWLFLESHLLKRLEFEELRRKSNEFVGKKADLLLW